METIEDNNGKDTNKNEKKSRFFDQGVTTDNKFLQFFVGSPIGIWGIPIAIIITGVFIYAIFFS